MKAKPLERENARQLRREGKSVKTIARELGVSTGSVSLWVKDIPLTDEQKSILGTGGNQHLASLANQEQSRSRRMEWQEAGREMYLREGKEFAAGCAVYWAEGSKRRNEVSFCNTDEKMLVFFLSFLRRFFGIKDEEVSLSINCYLNNGLTLEQIQHHWLKVLELPGSCVRKATLKSKYYDGKSSGKHPHGVCRVRVCKTDIHQKIFGAISEMIGNEGECWLD